MQLRDSSLGFDFSSIASSFTSALPQIGQTALQLQQMRNQLELQKAQMRAMQPSVMAPQGGYTASGQPWQSPSGYGYAQRPAWLIPAVIGGGLLLVLAMRGR